MPAFIAPPKRRNPPTYYAVFCKQGRTRFNANPVGAEIMQFDSLADRAEMIDRINKAHSIHVNEAAWPIKAKEAAQYVSLRDYFDDSHEEVCYTNGWIHITYRSRLITH